MEMEKLDMLEEISGSWVYGMEEEKLEKISLSEVLFTPFLVPVKSEYIFNR